MSDSSEYPGVPASPQPTAGVPPFQPVQPAFQPVATPGFAPAGPGGVAAPPPPPLQKGGTSALKIILIIVGVLVFLVLLAVGVVGYIGYRVAHSIQMDKNGSFSVNGPGGVISSSGDVKFTADDLGTDVYPGATAVKSGNFKMNLPSGSMMTATYTTADSKEKVIDFYKAKFGDGGTSMDFGGAAMITMKKSAHEVVTVTVTPKGDKTQIQISHTTDKTK